MDRSICLAIDVEASRDAVATALSTTQGQRSFWTDDCDVAETKARFGFPEAPVDLEADITVIPAANVRMTVSSGFPFWEGSTWEWQLGDAMRSESGTSILFRHFGFGEGYPEADLAYTAQTWALVLDRLGSYLRTGVPQPFFSTSGS